MEKMSIIEKYFSLKLSVLQGFIFNISVKIITGPSLSE